MASRHDGTIGNGWEFRLAVGAEVGYCLARETKERTGSVVEVAEDFVTVRDAQNRNEVRLGKADSIRVLDVGARDVADSAPRGKPVVVKPVRKTDEEKRAAKREYMRRWKANRRGIPCGMKVCEKCHEQYPVSSNAQRFCPACKAAGATAVGKPAPRVKPVAARAKTWPTTTADQDNPQANGGMTLVGAAQPLKYAPSTADVTPGTPRGAVVVDSQDVFRKLLVQQAEKYERLAAGCRELAASV